MSYNIGSLLLDVGVDISTARSSLSQVQNIYKSGLSTIARGFTKGLTDSVTGAVKGGFVGAVEGVEGAIAGAVIGGVQGGLAGVMGSVSEAFTSTIGQATEMAITSRLDLASNVLSGYVDNLVEGLMNYASEERSLRLADTVIGLRDIEGFNPVTNDPRETDRRILRLQKSVTEIATELSYSRSTIASLIEKLARTGIGREELIGNENSKASRASSLAATTAYLAEGMALPDFRMDEAVKLMTMARAAYGGDLSNSTLASGLLGVYSNTSQDTENLKYGLQDALPSAAAAGVSYQDILGLVTALGNFSSFEVAGTLAKTITNAIANPERIDKEVASALAPSELYKDTSGGFLAELKKEGNLLPGLKDLMDEIRKSIKEGRLASQPGMGKYTAEYANSLSERALDQLTQKYFVKLLGGNETMVQAARGITEQSDKQINSLVKSMEKFVSGNISEETTVLEGFTAVKQEGIKGAFDLVGSSIDNVKVLMGQELAPALVSFVSFFKNVANDLTANIGNMTGGLEFINDSFATLFNNPEFVGSFSRGMQNVIGKVNNIFVGWTENIVGFLDDTDRVNQAFEDIGNLTVTVAEGFTVLLGTLKAFLPVVGEWGKKLEVIGNSLSAQATRSSAKDEAEANRRALRAVGKGRFTKGVSTSTVDVQSDILVDSKGQKSARLENEDLQLTKELGPNVEKALRKSIERGIIKPETGRVKSGMFGDDRDIVNKKDSQSVNLALKGFSRLIDTATGKATNFLKSTTTRTGARNLYVYDEKKGEVRLARPDEALQAQTIVDSSNQDIKNKGKGAFDQRDVGSQGIGSLLPKEVRDQIEQEARDQFFDKDTKKPLNDLPAIEATKRYLGARDSELIKRQQEAVKDLFGSNVNYDPQTGNLENLTAANVDLANLANQPTQVENIIELIGSKGKFEGVEDNALDAFLSSSSSLEKDNDLAFVKAALTGESVKAGDTALRKGGLYTTVTGTNEKGEEITETRTILVTDEQVKAAVETGNREDFLKSLMESSNQNLEESRAKLLADLEAGKGLTEEGLPNLKFIESVIKDISSNKELNGNLDKHFEDLLVTLKAYANEKGISEEERYNRTKLVNEFTSQRRLDKGLEDVQTGNDATLTSDPKETQKLLNQLTQQRLKTEMEIARTKQRTLAIEREIVISSKAINGELNASLSEYAGILNTISNLRLRSSEVTQNVKNQVKDEQFSAKRQFSNITTEERTTNVAGQEVTYLVPTPDQSNANDIAKEQASRFQALQEKWLAEQEQFSKEIQSNILKIVNQVSRVAQSAIGNVTAVVSTLNQVGQGQNLNFADQGVRVLDGVKQQSIKLVQAIQTLQAVRQNSPGTFSPEQARNLNALLNQLGNLPSMVVGGINDVVDSFKDNLEKYFTELLAKQEQRDLEISRMQAGDNPALQALVQSRQEQLGLFQQLSESARQLSALQRESNALTRQGVLYQSLTSKFGKEGFDQTKVLMNQMAQQGNLAQREAIGLDRKGLVDSFQRKMALTFMQTLDKFSRKLNEVNNIFGDTSIYAYKFSQQLKELTKEYTAFDESIKALDVLYKQSSELLNESNLLKKEELDSVKEFYQSMKELNEELKTLTFTQQLERIQGETASVQARRQGLVSQGEVDQLRNKATLLRSENGYGDQDIKVAQLELAAKLKQFDNRLAEITAESGARINDLQNDLAIKIKSLKSGELKTSEERALATAEVRKLEEQIALEQQKLNNETAKIKNEKEIQLELAKDEVSMSGRVGKELANATKSIFDQLYDTLTEGGTSLGERFRNLGKSILKQFGKIGWDMLMSKITSGITNAFTKKDKTKGQNTGEQAKVVNNELDFGNKPDFEGFNVRMQEAFSVSPSTVAKMMSEQFAKRLGEFGDFTADESMAETIRKQFDLFGEELGSTDLGGLLANTSSMGIEGVAMNTSLIASNTKRMVELLTQMQESSYSGDYNDNTDSTNANNDNTNTNNDNTKARTSVNYSNRGTGTRAKDITDSERALLDGIAFSEGTTNYPNDGYNTLYGGSQFRGFSRHPNKIIKAGGYSSSAAGRYQIMNFHRKRMMAKYGNFTPESQDKFTLDLAYQVPGVRELVSQGKVLEALKKLTRVWEGLGFNQGVQPGGKSFSSIMKYIESTRRRRERKDTSKGNLQSNLGNSLTKDQSTPLSNSLTKDQSTPLSNPLTKDQSILPSNPLTKDQPILVASTNLAGLKGGNDMLEEPFNTNAQVTDKLTYSQNKLVEANAELIASIQQETQERKKNAESIDSQGKELYDYKEEKQSDVIPQKYKYPPIDHGADFTKSFLEDSAKFSVSPAKGNLQFKLQEQNQKNQFNLNQGIGLAQQALASVQSPVGDVVGKIGNIASTISSGGGFGSIFMALLPMLAGLFSGGRKPKRYNTGVSTVPGSGTTDSVPALLTPGEAVLTRTAVERLGGKDFIEAANFGRKGFLHKTTGGVIPNHFGVSNRDIKYFNKGGIVKPEKLGMKKFTQPLRASYTALEAQKYNQQTENQRNIERFVNKSSDSPTDTQGNTRNKMNIEYQSTVINSVEYVTAEDFRQGIEEAISRSQQGVYKTMRTSPRTRRALGL